MVVPEAATKPCRPDGDAGISKGAKDAKNDVPGCAVGNSNGANDAKVEVALELELPS